MNNTEILWGRHPDYAWGNWIKLGRGNCSDEFEFRSRQGFELVFCRKDLNPNGEINYHPGHPWYYFLGGRVLYPKEIMNAVAQDGYRGYLTGQFEAADRKPEPQRSEALRQLKVEEIRGYKRDLSRYRDLARELSGYAKTRREEDGLKSSCDPIHTNISLKHNHLYNRFAHLITLDELLSRQPDLFG